MSSASTDTPVKTNETKQEPVSTHKFLVHHKGDHVGVATTPIQKGEKVTGVFMDDDTKLEVVSLGDIPLGHKISLITLDVNEKVMKYGVQVGLTTQAWSIGDYVHTHNMKTARW